MKPVQMSRDEAISLAKQVASEEDWEWREPVDASKRHKWLFGPYVWSVFTNAECRGGNIHVVIDDSTGEVLSKSYLRR
jgi:hypothetical protein